MDLVDLIKLVIPREEREQGQDFKIDAAHAPVVHLVVVIAVSEQTLGWPIPPRADVFRERWLRVYPAT